MLVHSWVWTGRLMRIHTFLYCHTASSSATPCVPAARRLTHSAIRCVWCTVRTLRGGWVRRRGTRPLWGWLSRKRPEGGGWLLRPLTLEREIPMFQRNSLEFTGHGVRYGSLRGTHWRIPHIAMEIDSAMNSLLLGIETTGHMHETCMKITRVRPPHNCF